MEENKLMDLKISGSSSMPGGKYNEVKISGSGKMEGDLECKTIKVSGSANINGNVKSEEVKVSGSCSFQGSIDTKEIKVSGSTNIKGDLKAQSLKISGSTKVSGKGNFEELSISGSLESGDVRAKEIRLSGNLKSHKNVEADNINFDGKFNIENLLNGDDIYVALNGQSYAKDIGGQNIRVERSSVNRRGILSLFINFGGSNGRLKADTIEGDNISLDYTEAQIVRGTRVTIGKGCHIKKVEYSEIYEVDEGAKVEEAIKVEN